MTWGDGGLQHSDGAGNLVFASHLNTKAMQERGNKVIDGCIVTEQSPTPDLTVEVASGNVIANGIVVAVSAADPFVGTPNTFATTQGNLTGGQAEFVAVHVDSSGTITNTEGGAAVAGQQLPPEVPEDEVLLAMITLTEGDSTINTATDIEDWRQFVPDGQYIAGNGEITGNFDISGHDLASIGLKLAGTLVTSSAAELNVLDGVTAFSGTPSDIANSASAGSSTVIPRLDHVHAHPSGLTSNLHHTKYALLDDLIANEITAIQAIDSVTIDNTQWGYLGGLDQALAQANSPIFGGLTLSGDLLVNGGDIGITADSDLIQLADSAVTINGSLTTDDVIVVGDASAVEPTNTDTGGSTVGTSSKRWEQMWMNPTPTASGTALVITTGGQIIKTSSSRRYKENFGEFDLPTSILYDFPKPQFYNFKGQNDVRAFGYIAEDIEEILSEVIHYDEKGLVDSIDYQRLTVMLIEEYKIMKKELIELKQRI